ncbi:metal-sulfur cluster assembly factor [Xanthobacteraceae bacterium Astr-EGSB]|uniref:metal-sulfur cluster assembly factor n=1 Tax=Astrobacterium formosum TaxID=3069710 RepID=UPI0027B84677|nr:metal-sulfur cluster assembly factor [Xanthobacteraceae bacterium Astr-EGSB]
MTAALEQQVRDALRLVLDPELGENIVDLGLIYDVAVSGDGAVKVTMTTTTPGCPAAEYLREGVSNCVLAVAGVAAAEVTLTYEPMWTPARMSAAAQGRLRGA